MSILPLLMGGGQDAEFVLTNITYSDGSGVQARDLSAFTVGDLCLVYFGNGGGGTPTFAGTGWTTISLTDPYGYITRIFWKVLEAGDIGSHAVGGAATLGAAMLAVSWRGPTSLALRQEDAGASAGASTLTLSAIAPASNSAGVITLVVDRDPATVFVRPTLAGLSQRSMTADLHRVELCDFLMSGDYPDAAMTWTGFGTTFYQWGHILELLK